MLLQEFPAYTLEGLQRADVTHLLAILDERRAQMALRLFNGGSDGRKQLAERPDLMQLLLEIAQAQQGAGVTIDDVYRDIAASHPTDEDE